jgi:hypothetical protein
MQNHTLVKIAQFRTMAARKGKAFDVVRFASDRDFALSTLTQMLNDCDEELHLAGMALMDAMGLVSTKASAKPAVASSANAEHDFLARKREAVRLLNDTVGPMCEGLAIRMERTRSPSELRPLISAAIKVIDSARGRSAAEAYAAHCTSV